MNPIFKRSDFIPDVEARVMPDGRAYFYGSQDKCKDYWCSGEYKVYSTADMVSFTDHGKSFDINRLEGNTVSARLYSCDCIHKDGKYYLYPSSNGGPEWVAESGSPTYFEKGVRMKNVHGIDATVLVDDDGQPYYYWGQKNLKAAKLKPDMTEVDESTIRENILTEKEHFFHEGASIRKRGGVYYMVFADGSRNGKNSHYGFTPTCLGYATGESPFGPFTYRGVIIDNVSCDPAAWNNHGSIECINGQWYVFYHRSTCCTPYMRRACCEKIEFDGNGLIPEVPMTSSGAQDFIEASGTLGAELFCSLSGGCYLAADKPVEKLTNISPAAVAVMRYIKLSAKNTHIKIEGGGEGKITVAVKDKKNITAIAAEIDFCGGKNNTFPIKAPDGIYELIFSFRSSKNLEISSVAF